MHPSTIKLLSTTVAELPPIIDAHILDHLHGAHLHIKLNYYWMVTMNNYTLYLAKDYNDLIAILNERAQPEYKDYLCKNVQAVIRSISADKGGCALLVKIFKVLYTDYNITVYLDNVFDKHTAIEVLRTTKSYIAMRNDDKQHVHKSITLSPVLTAQLILEG